MVAAGAAVPDVRLDEEPPEEAVLDEPEPEPEPEEEEAEAPEKLAGALQLQKKEEAK